jgi:hypothetical protein
MRRFPLFLTIFAMLACTLAAAQQTSQPKTHQMSGPPKVLYIVREDVKPGKNYAHSQHEAAWTQALVKANYGTHMLAVSSVTGPAQEWFLVGFDSFADLEKDSQQMEKNAALRNIMQEYSVKEADYVSEARTVTARYQPQLSYEPNFNLGEYKYFTIGILRMKMGHDAADIVNIVNTARKKADMDQHLVCFEVNSGMPAGTYLFFSPVKSLAKWDEPPNKAYQEALKEANFMSTAEKDVASYEVRLFAFEPKASSMPQEVTSADPEFWHPKAEMASTTATHKAKPAAKKETKGASAKHE